MDMIKDKDPDPGGKLIVSAA